MKAVKISFNQMLLQIKRDLMLYIMAFVPFFTGAVIRFFIPFAEYKLTEYFQKPYLISPYYILIDAFLIFLTPTMINFIVAMIILEEADDHIITYLSVTPLGRKGYLISHLVMPSLLTIPVNILVSYLFHLIGFGLIKTFYLSVISAVSGIIISLLIVTLSSNKVEGMAIGKLTTLFSIGLAIPFVLTISFQYIFTILPTYWIGKYLINSNLYYLLLSLLISILWIGCLIKKFLAKL